MGIRWTLVMANYNVILVTLEEISDETGKVGSEAHSLLTRCSTFECLFYMSLLNKIFQVMSVLSEYLQCSKISVGSVSCRRTLSVKRTAKHFNNLWMTTEQKTKQLNLEPPEVPRKRTMPKKLMMSNALVIFTRQLNLCTEPTFMKHLIQLLVRSRRIFQKTICQH